MQDADRVRRLKSPLTDRQIRHLDDWGYPYVMDEFRFHMTLTGRLPDSRTLEWAITALGSLYAPVNTPITIGAVTVAEQTARDQRFRVRLRAKLGG